MIIEIREDDCYPCKNPIVKIELISGNMVNIDYSKETKVKELDKAILLCHRVINQLEINKNERLKMPNLLYTIGLQRSGKSTICDKWAKAAPMRAIVNSDSIRLALTGKRYEPLAETMVFATKHVMIRALLNRGFDVIVDGTHSTEISIQRILEIDINAKAIPIQTEYSTCIQRAIDTNQSDLVPSINRVYNNLVRLGLYSQDYSDWRYDDISLCIHSENGIIEYFDSTGQFNIAIDKIKQKVIERNLYGNLGEQS